MARYKNLTLKKFQTKNKKNALKHFNKTRTRKKTSTK